MTGELRDVAELLARVENGGDRLGRIRVQRPPRRARRPPRVPTRRAPRSPAASGPSNMHREADARPRGEGVVQRGFFLPCFELLVDRGTARRDLHDTLVRLDREIDVPLAVGDAVRGDRARRRSRDRPAAPSSATTPPHRPGPAGARQAAAPVSARVSRGLRREHLAERSRGLLAVPALDRLPAGACGVLLCGLRRSGEQQDQEDAGVHGVPPPEQSQCPHARRRNR